MSRRQKLLSESERSASMMSTIWKQRVVLQKDLKALDNSQRMVVNRISLNQRILFKKFRKKIHKAKLAHARIMGDRDAEQSLRDRTEYQASHFNTNAGTDPEEEDMLKRVWNHGRRQRELDLARRNTRSAPPDRAGKLLSARSTDDRATPKVKKSVYIETGCNHGNKTQRSPQRSQTAMDDKSTRRPATAFDIPHVTTVSDKEEDDVSETSDDSDDDNNADSPNTRLGVRFNKKLSPRERQTKSAVGPLTGPKSPDHHGYPLTPRPDTVASTNIFDDKPKINLLDIQKERMEKANYEDRVKNLCVKMTPYKTEKKYLLADYYQHCMIKDSLALRGRPIKSRDEEVTSHAEITRAMGNVRVRSMTLKGLTYDFGRSCGATS